MRFLSVTYLLAYQLRLAAAVNQADYNEEDSGADRGDDAHTRSRQGERDYGYTGCEPKVDGDVVKGEYTSAVFIGQVTLNCGIGANLRHLSSHSDRCAADHEGGKRMDR